MQGLAVHGIVSADPDERREILDFLKQLSRQVLTQIQREET
jgi:hypothetical protein